MLLKTWGPVLFATMLFAISLGIKLIAFNNSNVWLEISPEMSLWGVGIFFSLAIAEDTKLSGKTRHRIIRNPAGDGVTIKYDIVLPESIESSVHHLYLFVFALMIWIISLLLSGRAVQLFSSLNSWTFEICAINAIGIVLSGVVIGAAVRSLHEVNNG